MVNTGRPEADWEWGVRGGGAPPTGRPEADWEWGVRGGGAPPTKGEYGARVEEHKFPVMVRE